MAGRRLSADEAALWQRVIATVRPARTVIDAAPIAPAPPTPQQGRAAHAAIPRPKPGPVPARKPGPALPPAKSPPGPGQTLDGGWDRRLAAGAVAPDSVVDLHEHTLDTAYVALDQGLDRALRRGDRVLLLITGRPPRPESERPHARGRIRAAVGDWLAASRHSARIAAVRPAHPRHGGAGALYIVIRRDRDRNY
ncbi:MAG: DNA mismatch repair protein MutS [Sphingomonas sp. 28-66-16]|nr:MAG: DNA mismatch repair protein MutS [Sphingomonas sp. 28-66-16]